VVFAIKSVLWGSHPIEAVRASTHRENMQHTLSRPPIGLSDRTPESLLNIVIAYEHFESGKHAKQTCDVIAENLKYECRCNAQMWKFEVLSISKLREMAVADAREAHIIVVACQRNSKLPAHVVEWLTSGLARQGRAIALVALFQCPPSEASAVRHELATLAERAGVRFFVHLEPVARGPRAVQSISPEPVNACQERAFSTLTGAIQHGASSPRRGINE
jgi:hypothetical protein